MKRESEGAAAKPLLVSVAIVTYNSSLERLGRTLDALHGAVGYAQGRGMALQAQLLVVDNSTRRGQRAACAGVVRGWGRERKQPRFHSVELWHPGANIGYGAGHNQALDKAHSCYHLILNPDAELDEDALYRGLVYLQAQDDAVLVAPAARDAQDHPLHLCKRYPSVLALALRAFAPAFIRECFRTYLHRYEARDLRGEGTADALLVSGCCILARTAALREISGFSPRFFMYFEDFDLSLRLRPLGRLVHLEEMGIVHHGGHSARKGLRHIFMFAYSGWKFFHRHGWRWI